MVLVLWQGRALTTPTGTAFASSASACLILNYEARMSNDEGMIKPKQPCEHSALRYPNVRASFVIGTSSFGLTNPDRGCSRAASFCESPPAGVRLLFAGPPGASAVQGWGPGQHSLAMP